MPRRRQVGLLTTALARRTRRATKRARLANIQLVFRFWEERYGCSDRTEFLRACQLAGWTAADFSRLAAWLRRWAP